MNIIEAKQIACELMGIYGLESWTLEFGEAKNLFGVCYHSKQIIRLSRPLVELNGSNHVIDIILHEIAHALADKWDGHNQNWRNIALAIGCNGSRCYGADVVQPKAKYQTHCPNCKKIGTRNKKTKSLSCGACCRAFNHGRWTKKYKLRFIRL